MDMPLVECQGMGGDRDKIRTDPSTICTYTLLLIMQNRFETTSLSSIPLAVSTPIFNCFRFVQWAESKIRYTRYIASSAPSHVRISTSHARLLPLGLFN